jgi:hypothetical protein
MNKHKTHSVVRDLLALVETHLVAGKVLQASRAFKNSSEMLRVEVALVGLPLVTSLKSSKKCLDKNKGVVKLKLRPRDKTL